MRRMLFLSSIAVVLFTVTHESVGAGTDIDFGQVGTDAPRRQRNPAFEHRYNRDYALVDKGGSDRTEWAVLHAMRWLKANQNEDGSWGEAPFKTGLTGLALLCFLGHGEDQSSLEFGEAVRSAITYLVEIQDKDGYFPAESYPACQHAIATAAMADAYGMTGLQALDPVVRKAVRLICEDQTPQGGWYGEDAATNPDGSRAEGGDTNLAGWEIQALNAAWDVGIEFDDNWLRDAREHAVADLKSRFSADTGFGHKGAKPSGTEEENLCPTAVGTASLISLGERQSREAQGGLALLKESTFSWKEGTGDADDPLYGWYWLTEATLRATASPHDDQDWKRWNEQFSAGLMKMQEGDGHWKYPPVEAETILGAGLKERSLDVYTTATCCLMLEIYYRYRRELPAVDEPPTE